jgi:hypothetical protein
MNMIKTLSIALLAGASALMSVPAGAQVFRAYVSSTGSDSNPCSVAAPCRLLPAALSAVASGGEIWILDSANYNTSTVNINKSVTILAVPGVVGSIVAAGSSDAILIGTAGVNVVLRNLVIIPALGPGASGIHVTADSTLSVEGCQIYGLAGNGIHVQAQAQARVVDSTIRGNANGIVAENLATIDVAHTKLLGHVSHGALASGAAIGFTSVRLFDVVLADNAVGARASSAVANARAVVQANRVTASGNTSYGFASEATGSGITVVSLGNSASQSNGTGLLQSGTNATFRSIGDNLVSDNGINVIGTIAALAPR